MTDDSSEVWSRRCDAPAPPPVNAASGKLRARRAPAARGSHTPVESVMMWSRLSGRTNYVTREGDTLNDIIVFITQPTILNFCRCRRGPRQRPMCSPWSSATTPRLRNRGFAVRKRRGCDTHRTCFTPMSTRPFRRERQDCLPTITIQQQASTAVLAGWWPEQCPASSLQIVRTLARSDGCCSRDDTFIVMPRLLHYLRLADHTKPLYLGTYITGRDGCGATGTCCSDWKEPCVLPLPACARGGGGKNATSHCAMNVAGEVSRHCGSCTCPVSADTRDAAGRPIYRLDEQSLLAWCPVSFAYGGAGIVLSTGC